MVAQWEEDLLALDWWVVDQWEEDWWEEHWLVVDWWEEDLWVPLAEAMLNLVRLLECPQEKAEVLPLRLAARLADSQMLKVLGKCLAFEGLDLPVGHCLVDPPVPGLWVDSTDPVQGGLKRLVLIEMEFGTQAGLFGLEFLHLERWALLVIELVGLVR